MNDPRSPERWIIGALLTVGLLTFFFPLASVQLPILGNLSLSGYDLFSKARSFDRELNNITSKQEGNPKLEEAPVEPQSRAHAADPELPVSVRNLVLVPAEIIVSFGFVLIALFCCVGPLGPGSLKATSTLGALAAIVAVLHIVIADSDLHTWFQEQMRSNSPDLAGNPFAALAQGLATAISNSVHLAPGPGLFVLAGSVSFSAILAHSGILSRVSRQDAELASEADHSHGASRLFGFVTVLAVVIVLAVVVLIHQPTQTPTSKLPTPSLAAENRVTPANETAADNQESRIPNSDGLEPTGAPDSNQERVRLAEALTEVSAKQGHNHLYTACRGDELCIADQNAPNDGFIENFSANTGIATRLFNVGFRSIEISNGSRVWDEEITTSGFVPATGNVSPENSETQ